MTAAKTKRTDVVLDAIPLVSVIDEDPAARREMRSLIQSAGWQAQLLTSAHELLRQPRRLMPGCVILETSLSDMSGLKLQKLIAHRTELPIIFVTTRGDVQTTVQAMKAGAHEFLSKPAEHATMRAAIASAIQRSRAALGEELELAELQARHERLTSRECQVLNLVVEGYPNKVIAAKLKISQVTVKAHRGSAVRKMRARNIVDLIHITNRLAGVHRSPPIPRNDRLQNRSSAMPSPPSAPFEGPIAFGGARIDPPQNHWMGRTASTQIGLAD